MHFLRTVLPLAAALLVAATAAEARPHRPAQVPNGSSLGCALCHTNPAGGGPRNVFGQMVGADFLSSGDVVWGPELAALDADGDGATNGEELQDPDGSWSIGDPAPGDAEAVTEPWNPDSTPPPPMPTAVAATTWAKVKAAIGALTD